MRHPPPFLHPRPPEVLAPAGNLECARAAVENGADAIYFGLDRFNARMRAGNFTAADLPTLMGFLHERGVKGYLTLNTLIFTDELSDAARFLEIAISAGVDAAIIQDIGMCRLIRSLSPDFPIHASTQMTVTSPAGVDFASALGATVVVLARENTLQELEQIQAANRASATPVDLEVFVHGALCVAYSGQCLTSEALGGRSANRGECAQACRLPYDLVTDGKTTPLEGRRYLLSPQDLSGVELVPQLTRLGVASLKIEGRLKTPEYVANITRVYRAAVDRAVAGEPFAVPQYELEMAFSRGLSTGWLGGLDNQKLVHARFGKKRGVLLGEVQEVTEDAIRLTPLAPVAPGDGVVFDLGKPESVETGGRLHRVEIRDGSTWLGFRRRDLDWSKVQVGAKVWKTSDPRLDRELRASFEGETIRHRRPVHMNVAGRAGAPLVLTVTDADGRVGTARTEHLLTPADHHPLTTGQLRQQLGRLGTTPFLLGDLENRLEGDIILPVSALNQARRDAVAELLEQRRRGPRWTLVASADEALERVSPGRETDTENAARAPELILLVRDLEQLEAALPLADRDLYAEFEDPKRYRDAMHRVREWRQAHQADRRLWVAPPRIFKPGEDWVLKILRSSEPDGYLVRNADHLSTLDDRPRRGDFSLNVANPVSARYLLDRYALESLTASYDLNIEQLTGLLEGAPPHWFEVTVHQHMPLFHMEHCVFCAFLSSGKDYRDCGRPCEKHRVRLRDRVGQEHLLRADAGCRNTVFNARTQTGAEFVPHLLGLGLRRFRIEFLEETPGQIADLVRRYRQLLRGEIGGEQLWREFKLHNQLGVTRGALATSGAAD